MKRSRGTSGGGVKTDGQKKGGSAKEPTTEVSARRQTKRSQPKCRVVGRWKEKAERRRGCQKNKVGGVAQGGGIRKKIKNQDKSAQAT